MKDPQLIDRIFSLESELAEAKRESETWRLNCIEAMRAGNQYISQLEYQVKVCKTLMNVLLNYKPSLEEYAIELIETVLEQVNGKF